MSYCLVTGGAGFIGSHLVDRLVQDGHRVRILDNLSAGRRENFAHHGSKVGFIQGDIRDAGAVARAVRNIEFVFHAAAIRAVLRSVDDPKTTNDVNVSGTLNLLMASKKAGVRRFIFSSTCSVYGDARKIPIDESAPLSPESPYAVSKIAGEFYCQLFSTLYGLSTVSLRYFNVYGPRQNPESKYSMVIPIVIDRLQKGKRPEIHWDGKQSRDFVYVGDVVTSNLLAMTAKKIDGHIFNIGSGEACSVLGIFSRVKRILKIRDALPLFRPKRKGDVRRTLADLSKARAALGYAPKTSFLTGLMHTVEWFIHKRQKGDL